VATPDELHRRATEVYDLVGRGRLRVHIGGIYPLAEAAAAHAALAGRRTVGKVLLVP
jgi:NADPH2:quinone reductase